MIDNVRLKNRTINLLLTLPVSDRVKEDDIVIRCPYCGDSVKHSNHGHLHVRINVNDDLPMIYHCFRCDESGIVNPGFLRDIDINDRSYNPELIRYNNKASKNFCKKLNISTKKLNYMNELPSIIELAEKKKEYIENRLGIKFTYDELIELKTVFNLAEFLYTNDLKVNDKMKPTVRLLTYNYVGFLSTDNEFIVLRNIYNDNNTRYYKYNVRPFMQEKANKLYIIPTTLDLLRTDEIYINIAEGIFDIFGIYYHIKNKDRKNNVYASVCGCGFVSASKYFLKLGIIGCNVTINIFSDKDKDIYFYKDLFKEIEPLVGHIYLYYNNIGKDYGVKKEEIELIRSKIK